MATYLLAWNPKRWAWDDLGEMSDTVQNGGKVETRWSCSKSKSIQAGDRVFFIRLGVPPKGIFASGNVNQGSYEDLHWDDERAERGETCRFVGVRFDRLLDPAHDTILARDLLDFPPFDSMHWDTQSSGVRIADVIAVELEKHWEQYSEIAKFTLPDEVSYDEDVYHEGALRQITVNAYERNSAARQKCIAVHGSRCGACGFDFGDFYGKDVKGYIHIHHLTQLSDIGEAYVVNPETDLVPVCANCHAVIHRRKPPYTLDEVRSMIQSAKTG